MLKYVCCIALQHIALWCSVVQRGEVWCIMLLYVAVWCVVQCVAVCCRLSD